MGAILATLTASFALLTTPADTLNPYASAATRALVERAMERQRSQDSLVQDYTATLRYRLTVSLGRRRWGRSAPAFVEEQDVRVEWQAPNDIRVEVLGRRARSPSGLSREAWSIWDRPWFVPRGLTDSIRIFSDEFPAIAPLHPLAADGPRWYRYELTDSAAMVLPNGRRIKVLVVDVTPAREAPALVAGRIWLDAATFETVRFAFRYVGKGLWIAPDSDTRKDSSDARRANGFINRVFTLDIDLEYGIQDGQYWMPWRQTISGRVTVPLVSDLVIPFEAVTTFRDYEINTGHAPVFTLEAPVGMSRDSSLARWHARQDTLRKARRAGEIPDSLWTRDYAGFWQGNGRFEVHRPSKDSLARYDGWGDSLVVATAPEDAGRMREIEGELGRLVEGLPNDITGEKPVRFAMQRPGDLVGFNRVQGWSLGAGIGVKLPGVSFTDAYGTLRYGFSDERVTGRLGVIRNGPGWKLTVDGYRDIVDQDLVSPGRNIANSVNAAFTTHDNADYMLGTGGSALLQFPLGESTELKLGARVEEQLSVERRATAGLNDFFGGTGVMLDNAPVTEGTFVGASATVTGRGPLRWSLTADVLSGAGTETGRLWGEARYSVGGSAGATLRARAGIASSPTLPQMQFRVGGQQTVRMYDYGQERGQAFWTGQLDVAPFSGWLRPVAFADVGWAGAASDFGDAPLVGVGLGASLYSKLFRSGVIRFDLSRGLSPDHPTLRFDIVFQAVR